MKFVKIASLRGDKLNKLSINYPLCLILEDKLVAILPNGKEVRSGIEFVFNFNLSPGGEEIGTGECWYYDSPQLFGIGRLKDNFQRNAYAHIDTPNWIVARLLECRNAYSDLDNFLIAQRDKLGDLEKINYRGATYQKDFGRLVVINIFDKTEYDRYLVELIKSEPKDFPVLLAVDEKGN